MLKVEEVDMEFTSAQELLKNACDLTKQVTLENAVSFINEILFPILLLSHLVMALFLSNFSFTP